MAPMSPQQLDGLERSLVNFLRQRGGARKTFMDLNLDHNGNVTPKELQAALKQKYDFPVSDEAIHRLCQKYDSQGDGKFDYQEFCHIWEGEYTQFLTSENLSQAMPYQNTGRTAGRGLKMMRGASPQHNSARQKVRSRLEQIERQGGAEDMSALFISFDRDKNGVLSYSEIHYGLSLLGIELSGMELKELLDPIDRDRDGDIHMYDFLSLMQPAPHEERGERPLKAAPPGRPRRTRAAAPAPFKHHHEPTIDTRIQDGSTDAKCMRTLVNAFEEKKLRMKAVFSKMDVNGDGGLAPKEFQEGLRQLGIEISPQRVNRLLQVYDYKKDGRIQYNEFIRMISAGNGEMFDEQCEARNSPDDARNDDDVNCILASISAPIYEKYRESRKAFSKFDRDGNKKCNKEEFVHVLRRVDPSISAEDAENVFHAVDRNGDGKVNYSEFMRMLSASGSR